MRHSPKIVLEPALPETKWPSRAGDAAFEGPAGAYVLELEEHTEADPHAVLVILLTAVSNIIGREPHLMVGRTRHPLNLYTVIVGQTGAGRKGTARDEAIHAVREVDPSWPDWVNGLSSGEGLIDAVRDPAMASSNAPNGVEAEHEHDNEDSTNPSGDTPTPDKTEDQSEGDDARNKTAVPARRAHQDEGVPDKRLLVMESELASVLQRMKRDGNSLSAVIRAAWDGEHVLRTLTKHSKVKATDAHISIVGQITQEELQHRLPDAELFNGFANRFLWVCAQRARRLPDGGHPNPIRLQRHRLALTDAIRRAHRSAAHDSRLTRSKAAERRWAILYDDLTAARPGLFGAATSRADAYVARLSCLYALLDRSMTVKTRHLDSAHALWGYCEASARYLFNASTGNADADRVLAKVREAGKTGLTRDEIRRQVFSGHCSSQQLFDVLVLLRDGGFIQDQRERTTGRTRERWIAQ